VIQLKNVQAGIIRDILNTLKGISERLFNYLGAPENVNISDKHIKLDEKKVKKIDDRTFEMPYTYQADGSAPLPYKVKMTLIKDDVADIEVTINLGDKPLKAEKKGVTADKFDKVTKDLLFSLLDDDTKQAFGIKSSKTMKVTLQKVVASKETSINLRAITADYDISDAYSTLDNLLSADEFTDAITEEPISFEIIDVGDEYDVSPCELAYSDALKYALAELICKALQFQMDMQIAHWYSAYNNDLCNITGSMLYEISSWTDKFGMWYIEVTDSVYQVSQGCTPVPLEIPDEMSMDEMVDAIGDCISTFVDNLDCQYVNLPHDMQNEVDYLIRNLKQTKDINLKQVKI
jgi:hypothetical protein